MGSESDKLNQVFTLKDGRKLGYAEFGDSKGKPIFYFHGYIGGRLEPKMSLSDKELGCRIISIDRPGIGLSSFKENREILDWPDDVMELADSLGIDMFSVVGLSGGGPYAAACAFKIPDRLIKVGIVAGMGPYKEIKKYMANPNKTLFSLINRFPLLHKRILKLQKKQMDNKDPEKLKTRLLKALTKSKKVPEPDKEVFKTPGFFEFLISHLQDIFQQGIEGASLDGRLYTKPWGFELKDIKETTPVFLWQGELDVNVPPGIGKYMASQIPNCKATYYPEESHLSLEANHFAEILESLTS
ncbi:MAG: alpha/beta fold hydrolase [Candidatus Heimdallarchaeaceae archaeon]